MPIRPLQFLYLFYLRLALILHTLFQGMYHIYLIKHCPQMNTALTKMPHFKVMNIALE